MNGSRGTSGGSASLVEREPAGNRNPRRALILIAISVLLVLLGIVGVFYDGSYFWVDRLFQHPFLFGCVAAYLCGVGLVQLLNKRWLKILVGLVSLTVVGAWLFVGIFWVAMVGTHTVETEDAPGDDYEAVVTKGADWIDTVWYVSIRQNNGLLSREWQVGCLSDDLGADTFKGLAWDGPNRLLVTTLGQTITVPIDPRTGKPQDSIMPLAGSGIC